jgi:hypothetical protein
MSKKQSYMNLLKEAISEFDTSDNLEVKGPMLDPIISWDGGGEIPTYKDAASILERYYFNEEQDRPIEVLGEEDAASEADKHTGDPLPAPDENDKGSASSKGMENAKGAGTEQAGTSDSPTILGSKEEKKEDIAKEDVELALDDLETALEEDAELDLKEDEWSDKDVPKAKKYREEEMTTEDEGSDMENAIIEKLISEMEEDDLDEADTKVMSYTGDDVAPGMNAKDEKKSRDPEEDTHGAGTDQAGTGPDEGQIPPRKDLHDKMVKPNVYRDENETTEGLKVLESDILKDLETELQEQDDDEPPVPDEGADEDEGEDLDVDKEMKESLDVLESELEQELGLEEAPSAVPGGPSPKKTGEDWEDDERYYGEAFELFKEEIENEDVDEIDSDDLRV